MNRLINSISRDETMTIPDSHHYILDPLTVIVKLAILSFKPPGTKITISENKVQFQSPGPWQSLCRYVYSNTKSDLHYLYNPIYFACELYLSEDYISQYNTLPELFNMALKGLDHMLKTYTNCPIIHLVIFYYKELIKRALDRSPCILRADRMTSMYSKDLIHQLTNKWSSDNIKVILELVVFFNTNTHSATNILSLETIISTVDTQMIHIFHPTTQTMTQVNVK